MSSLTKRLAKAMKRNPGPHDRAELYLAERKRSPSKRRGSRRGKNRPRAAA